MIDRGVSRALYPWYNPLRVSLPLVRENFRVVADNGDFLCLLFVLLCFYCVCCSYVATRSLDTFLSSVLAEGVLEGDHNL